MGRHMAPKSDTARRILVRSGKLPEFLPRAFGRTLDLALAFIALIVFAPVMLAVALAIAFERKGPVLFAHTRVGLAGRDFEVFKFRSMRVDGDAILAVHLASNPLAAREWELDHKLRDDPRVTALGRFLRKSSLDELPQLLNVLRGDMGIVGPRPIVKAEIERYGRCFKAYCSVRPGITGIWQVSGRNDVSYRRRVLMDALYARRKCMALDIKIILATVPAVLARKGSY